MDEKFLEVASDIQEKAQEYAILRSRQKSFPDKLLSPSQYRKVECEDCGSDLPDFRMQRGMIRCTGCQDFIEKQSKRFAR